MIIRRIRAFVCLSPMSCVVAACAGGDGSSPSQTAGTLAANIGDPCVLDDENRVAFPGVTVDEAMIDGTRGTDVCVAIAFQGRVSCPYGQSDPSAPECFTPEGDPVAVPVKPQLVSRPPELSVYRSCRCAGPADATDLCACPSGFACEPIAPELISGVGPRSLIGSYCVKPETTAQDQQSLDAALTCDRALRNCENR